jgi:hypothetical protein
LEGIVNLDPPKIKKTKTTTAVTNPRQNGWTEGENQRLLSGFRQYNIPGSGIMEVFDSISKISLGSKRTTLSCKNYFYKHWQKIAEHFPTHERAIEIVVSQKDKTVLIKELGEKPNYYVEFSFTDTDKPFRSDNMEFQLIRE